MILFVIAVGATACAVLPVAGISWVVVRLFRLRQGRRLERATPATVCAIDSTGRPYEAVAVEACAIHGQDMPADHQCTGRSA